ncbi:MAG: glycosyltransferase family 2 protein, partial [Gemmatimonas sp.]
MHYLLLWQRPTSLAPDWPANVELVELPGTGVANSRNAAIERCRTPWLWFMDDDVDFPPGSIDAVLALLPSCGAHQILVASVLLPDGRPLKRKPDGLRYGRRDILSVGTIQIVAHAGWLRSQGVRYPRRLGAGARDGGAGAAGKTGRETPAGNRAHPGLRRAAAGLEGEGGGGA